MFTFKTDSSVPANDLPKNGVYTANIIKIELTTSKTSQRPMIKVEASIPVTDALLSSQGKQFPVKVFDNVILPKDAADKLATLPARKLNSFIEAFGLENKGDDAIPALVGRGCKIEVRQQKDESYGDRLTISKYMVLTEEEANAAMPF